jgi:pimeloyl-ACP methyl ester carboxylesterase
VQWDQRGAGRTFAKNGAAGLTRERLIADGIDLAEQLHKRFPRGPRVLFGHSWGSIVGTGMAQQRPELFAAYVGTGQISSWADTVQLVEAYFNKVSAPKKRLIIIEDAGHFALATHQAEVIAALKGLIQ